MTVRATRVLGPVDVSGAVTDLGGPDVGERWKTESWFMFNPGALSAAVLVLLGPDAAGRKGVFHVQSVPAGSSVVLAHELVVDAPDSLFVELAALDVITLTVVAFVLTLP